MKSAFRLSTLCAALALMTGAALASDEPAKIDIRDPIIQRWYDITPDKMPPMPAPGSWGMDKATGKFVHPKATEAVHGAPSFDGQLKYWDQKDYALNMKVEAFYPLSASPYHEWQNIVDFGDRRIMYVYNRRHLKVFDITDPRDAKLLATKGSDWGKDGPTPEKDPFPAGDGIGAASIQWNAALNKYVMVQSFEVSRIGILEDKRSQPDKVDAIRHAGHLKGFKVYAMNGPLPDQWELIATRTTDVAHPAAPIGQQQGSGSLDVPAWYGGKYMFLATAPDDTYALAEYKDYLYSPGYQAWDMSNPANPKWLSNFAAPGQIIGDAAHEAAYLKNPRAGNRTSWMGARMPLFIPKPVEKGGKVAFAAMAGLGLYTLDISDPANMKIIGHLDLPPSFAGTEADNVNLSQYEKTGVIFLNGYPMNDECFEPYKDIFAIDVRDLKHPKIISTFPRPTPPKEASFTDFCQRRGSFGPKRPGYHTQPGQGREGLAIYAFYNAGIQIFDVKDPAKPTIAGYYVPRFPKDDEIFESVKGNLAFGTYIEYDRNIIWMFTNHGIYALSSPLLGPVKSGVPATPWPPRD